MVGVSVEVGSGCSDAVTLCVAVAELPSNRPPATTSPLLPRAAAAAFSSPRRVVLMVACIMVVELPWPNDITIDDFGGSAVVALEFAALSPGTTNNGRGCCCCGPFIIEVWR